MYILLEILSYLFTFQSINLFINRGNENNSIDLKHESIQNIYDINDNEISKMNLVERYSGMNK